MSKKTLIRITAITMVVMVATIVLLVIRDKKTEISISIERNTVNVGTEEDFGILAVAYGRYNGMLKILDPVIEGKLDKNTCGSYRITVSAEYKGKKKSETFQLKVVDELAPEITLLNKDGYYTLPGGTYEEEGFTAFDNGDGDLTDRVKRTETPDEVTYSVTDSAGNSTVVKRKIVYSDPVPPLVSVEGDAEVTRQRRQSFYDPGAIAADNFDGDLTDQITVEGTVDTSTVGDYTLTYTVRDSSGNLGIATRIVHVVERTKPLGEEEEPKGNVIYLTFDDGPGAYTQQLLDILDKYNVKVTFFVCNNARDDLILEEYKRGHTVAVHGWTHDYKDLYTSVEGFYKYFYKMQKRIYEITGEYTTMLRFPGGSSNAVSKQYCPGIMTELTKDVTERGLQFYDWNVLSGDADAKPISTEQVYQNVINGVKRLNGKPAVVLQHDVKKFSVDAVERIIIWGLENGYRFLPLDETSYPAHQWLNN